MSVVAEGTASIAKVTLSGPTRIGCVTRVMPNVSNNGWETPTRYIPGARLSTLNFPSESVAATKLPGSIRRSAPET